MALSPSRFSPSLACAMAFAWSLAPHAAGAAPATCVGAYFVESSTRLAEVVGTTNAVLLKGPSDDKRCPAAGPQTCAAPSRDLPAGAKVIVSDSVPGFVCATVLGDGGKTIRTGWLASDRTRDLPSPAGSVPAWVGTWISGDLRQLTIKQGAEPTQLQIDGSATDVPLDKAKAESGDFNQGSFAARSAPKDDRIAFAISGQSAPGAGEGVEADDGSMQYTLPYDAKAPGELCRVKIVRLATDYLVVEDNNQCGGRNVSFSGPYRKVDAGKR